MQQEYDCGSYYNQHKLGELNMEFDVYALSRGLFHDLISWFLMLSGGCLVDR